MTKQRALKICVLFFILVFMGQGNQSVLAQSSRFRGTGQKADQTSTQTLKELSKGFTSSDRNLSHYAVVFVIIAILIAGLVYLDWLYHQRRKGGFDNPQLLLRELCAAHQLTKLEQSLLNDIAVEYDLDDALPLFVEPQHFARALKEKRYAGQRKSILYLLEKFFDIRSETDARLGAAPPEPAKTETTFDTTLILPHQQD